MAQAKKTGQNLLSLAWQGTTGLVMLEPKQITLMFSGVIVSAEICAVACLNGRLRPLLRCPRAHEGNFQTLYLRGGKLACRQCHSLRYRSNLASTIGERLRLKRQKLIQRMGGEAFETMPAHQATMWGRRHKKQARQLSAVSLQHYSALRKQLLEQNVHSITTNAKPLLDQPTCE